MAAAAGPRLVVVPKKAQFRERASQGKAESTREWTRAETLGLSSAGCTQCLGLGTIRGQRSSRPCGCVLRKIFRLCFDRFRSVGVEQANPSRVALGGPLAERAERGAKTVRRSSSYGFPGEEYRADFLLIARRALDDEQYKAFRLHWLLGADYRLCCAKLQIDRGTFFHLVYRIEQLLGRALAETRPYPLWPLDQYFGCLRRESSLRKAKRGDEWLADAA